MECGIMNWDNWRKQYDNMSFDDQRQFYAKVAQKHPNQQHYNYQTARFFFNNVAEHDSTILELGGWKGELAQKCLMEFNSKIKEWINVDLVQFGNNSGKYRELALDRFIWEYNWLKDLPTHQIFVSTHTFEHLSEEHVRAIIKKLYSKYVYLEIPLERYRRDWNGYQGSHKLPMMQVEIADAMIEAGYTPIMRFGWATMWRLK